jgi:hypothetical protein
MRSIPIAMRKPEAALIIRDNIQTERSVVSEVVIKLVIDESMPENTAPKPILATKTPIALNAVSSSKSIVDLSETHAEKLVQSAFSTLPR